MGFKNQSQITSQDDKYKIYINKDGTSLLNSSLSNNSFLQQDKNIKEVLVKKGRLVGILDGLITVCLVAIFLGVPLFFTGLTLQGISFEKEIYFYFWILLALVAWASKGIVSEEIKIRLTPLDFPLLLFWLFYAIAVFFSVDRWHSFWGYFGDPSRGFINLTALIIGYYLVVSHFDKKRFFLMLGGLIMADFVIAIWSLLIMLGVPVINEKISQFIPLSFIGSLTCLGIFMASMLPIIALVIFRIYKKKSEKGYFNNLVMTGFLLLLLVMNLIVMLLLYSFVSWLGVLFGVSFLLVYILAKIAAPVQARGWVPGIIFVAILAILIINTNSFARIQLPVEVTPAAELSWNIAKSSLRDNFIIGSGPATYAYDFSLYKPQDFNLNPYYNLRFFQGSGLFFEAISTIGVFGTILLLLLTLTFLSVSIYMLSIDKEKNKINSLGIFSATLIILINAFVGKIEGSIIILGVLLAALTIAMLGQESESEKKYLNLSLKASAKFALAWAFVFIVISTGVVFVFIFIGKMYMADLRAGGAARELKITENGSISKLADAIALNSRESRYYSLLSQQLMSLANEETIKGEKDRNLSLIKNYLNNSISAVIKARELSQKDVSAVEALAQIYENSGLYVADSFSLAAETYKKALELEPHNPIYPLKLGQIQLAQASSKKTSDEAKISVQAAKDFFQKAIEEKNNFAPAFYQLALSQEALGEIDEAIKSIEQAARFDQNNLNYIFNVARIHQARGNAEDNKIAEIIYKNILQKNNSDMNSHFSLGLLYEKTKKTNEASNEYKKVLELIPVEQKDIIAQLGKMISNVEAGIENTPENIKTNSLIDDSAKIPATAIQTQPMDRGIRPDLKLMCSVNQLELLIQDQVLQS